MAATPEQILQAVQELSAQIVNAISSAKLSPKQVTIVNGLSDINNSLGTVRAGEILALSDGEDPQDADGTGTFISALGRVFGTKTFHIGGVYNGDLKWGANAITGELEAGDSAVVLTENGVSVYDGATEIARLGNLNGFLSYSTDVYGIAIGTSTQYLTYDTTNGLKVYGALVSDREILTADRTYYVRTDGNDSNTGLANTSGGAFLTIQHALDYISTTLDTREFDITVQLGDGTYNITTSILTRQLGGTGKVTILGDSSTPSNVLISYTNTNVYTAAIKATDVSTIYVLNGFKIVSEGGALLASHSSHIKFLNLDFGSCVKWHVKSEWAGNAEIIGNYAITGNASNHFMAVEMGQIIYDGLSTATITITITNTPTIGVFANGAITGLVYVPYLSFSGSATGKRYTADYNGIIAGTGASATYFPGDVAGTVSTGGIYN